MNLTFGNMSVEVNIYNLMAQPNLDEEDITDADFLDTLVQEFAQSENPENPLRSLSSVSVLDDTPTPVDGEELVEEAMWCSRYEELPQRDSLPLPSSLEIPKLELKELPKSSSTLSWGIESHSRWLFLLTLTPVKKRA